MKLLVDFFPILLFFGAYKFFGIYVATGVAIAVALMQVLWNWFVNRRVEFLPMMTLVLISLLGGATLILHNIMFIKWKPTVFNWIFSAAILGSHWFGEKPITQRLMESNITLPKEIWYKLNLTWAMFFLGLGLANLYVVYHFSTDTWVNFKLFGIVGLTIGFVLLQSVYLSKHMESDKVG